MMLKHDMIMTRHGLEEKSSNKHLPVNIGKTIAQEYKTSIQNLKFTHLTKD